MKTRLLSLLVLMIASSVMAYTWGDSYLVQPKFDFTEEQVILTPGGFDSPQPDTILYDNNAPGTLITGGPKYADTRFTAPVEFNLISVYILPLNQYNNTTDRMTIIVAGDNGSGLPLPTPLATMMIPAPIPGYNIWIDMDLPDTLTFDAGEDFHIMYSCPCGDYVPGNGWWPFFDNASTGNRSKYASTPTATLWYNITGDLMIRAGGILSGGFIDLTTTSVYNTSSDFILWTDDQITFKADVDNLGITEADVFLFTWEVEDESGTVIWSDETIYSNLAGGGSVTLTAGNAWSPSSEGVYTVVGTATHPDDADPSNDANYLEQMVVVYDVNTPVWLSYDDGTAETNFSFSPGDAIGNSFSPPLYPITVDSISISSSGGAQADVKILQNDGLGGIPQTELWHSSVTLAAGWSHYAPAVDVFGDGFTVVIEPIASLSMQMDDDEPNAGANSSMPTVAWQGGTAGWEDFERGDLMIRAKIRESDAVPPMAILEVSADPIEFGAVSVGYPASMDFTMYNTGGVDALQITSINFNPATVFSVTGFTPMTQIPAGDSLEVQIVFDPIVAQLYSGLVGILHNSPVTPFPLMIPISGEGTLGVGDWNAGELKTYQLAQNLPNPFNPTTSINFNIPADSHVELTVYNVLGKEIARLVDNRLSAGQYSATFDASELSSGIYFYRMTAGDFSEMKKMILMK